MFEIKGKVNTAICYAKVVEQEAIDQIARMCDYEFTAGSRIRIMPDVHAGKGCTIGTTMTVHDKAVPNIVGVDIGCGMYTVSLGEHTMCLPGKMSGRADRSGLIWRDCGVIGVLRIPNAWREVWEH